MCSKTAEVERNFKEKTHHEATALTKEEWLSAAEDKKKSVLSSTEIIAFVTVVAKKSKELKYGQAKIMIKKAFFMYIFIIAFFQTWSFRSGLRFSRFLCCLVS